MDARETGTETKMAGKLDDGVALARVGDHAYASVLWSVLELSSSLFTICPGQKGPAEAQRKTVQR